MSEQKRVIYTKEELAAKVKVPAIVEQDLKRIISDRLEQCGLYYRVFSRIKTASSMAHKFALKDYGAENKKLQDLVGVRINLYFDDDVEICQNIVENSFEHGFTGMAPEEKRQIIITARKMGDRMILRVRDNGRGMSLKQVEEMNQKFSQPYDAIALRHQKEHGIGLDNINDRLQIFSHSNDRLVLRSREGKYTSMFILQTL